MRRFPILPEDLAPALQGMLMPIHRFTVGQAVRLTNLTALSPKAASTYTVQAPMPVRDNSPQYRLYNEEFNQGRVAMERDLELVLNA